jgi:hypothetical protein
VVPPVLPLLCAAGRHSGYTLKAGSQIHRAGVPVFRTKDRVSERHIAELAPLLLTE